MEWILLLSTVDTSFGNASTGKEESLELSDEHSSLDGIFCTRLCWCEYGNLTSLIVPTLLMGT